MRKVDDREEKRKKGKKKEKNGVFSGHYVIASSLPPERLRPNDDRWNAACSCQYLSRKIYLNFILEPNTCNRYTDNYQAVFPVHYKIVSYVLYSAVSSVYYFTVFLLPDSLSFVLLGSFFSALIDFFLLNATSQSFLFII